MHGDGVQVQGRQATTSGCLPDGTKLGVMFWETDDEGDVHVYNSEHSFYFALPAASTRTPLLLQDKPLPRNSSTRI